MHRGAVDGLAAYLLWGVLPLYWKMLPSGSASEILAHRVIWSLLFCSLLVMLRQGFAWLPILVKQTRSLWTLFAASLLSTWSIVTAIPLLFFAAVAKRIPLALLELLPYLAPTMQFCMGLLICNEAFPASRLIGLSCIWLGLTLLILRAMDRR